MILDFIGFEAMSWNPLEGLGVYLWNRKWSGSTARAPDLVDLTLFVGELEDVPNESFGLFLPNRREWAKETCEFVGYVLPFDPEEIPDQASLRAELGYDERPLVICSIGGTAIGKDLLELCGQAYLRAATEVPDLHMVLVCGPRLAPDSVELPVGAEAVGYVPDLYKHLAASDLAIVQGGGTVTLELTALRRPFLYFPIEGHSEQEVHVAGRLRRHGAGIERRLSSTDPEGLAADIVANLGQCPTYPPIPAAGARLAARKIRDLL
jgi:UDP:flavonoid glycosyltransferase YjiC (YdhE family)